MLWDTAGQEEFDAITKAYYRGAQACVVAFSTTDRASFDAVRKWKKKVRKQHFYRVFALFFAHYLKVEKLDCASYRNLFNV